MDGVADMTVNSGLDGDFTSSFGCDIGNDGMFTGAAVIYSCSSVDVVGFIGKLLDGTILLLGSLISVVDAAVGNTVDGQLVKDGSDVVGL
mmetsp:Transcript_33691/g.40789  ORF Transcript_33691/g.40789 Transcript_33691/m.40789 type:complete len:90 (-) Transcript_33691:15-284(-)